MIVERPEELWAFEVVGRILGVEVEPYDICGRRYAVDGLLHYPDVREAALEISSIGPETEAAITNVLDRPGQSRRTVAGLTQSWRVAVPHTFHPRGLRQLDRVLLRCEKVGVTDLEHLYSREPFDGSRSEVVEWVEAGVSARVDDRDDSAEPTVRVTTGGVGGGTGNGHDLLAGELDAELATEKMRSKIRKLANLGHAERHLFLRVRLSAFSFAVTDTVYFGGPLPTEAPQLPNGLTQVWLASGHAAGGVIRAIAGQKWIRDTRYPVSWAR